MLRCRDIILKSTHNYTDIIIICINHVDNRWLVTTYINDNIRARNDILYMRLLKKANICM